MRARQPDREGFVESQGARIAWEEYGSGERTVVLVPGWQIVHSRMWKMQNPYFARYFRVVAYDPSGNGRSDRPPVEYGIERNADELLAVLDATGTARASLVCHSRGTWYGALLAKRHPERVDCLVLVATSIAEGPRVPRFFVREERHEGWGKMNAHYMREHYRDFLEFFMGEAYPEPHSTKPREDGVAWGLETAPEVPIDALHRSLTATSVPDLLAGIAAPVLLVHGTDDHVRPLAIAERVHAAIEGSTLLTFAGSGHCPHVRDPVRFNLTVRDFLGPARPPRPTWPRAAGRPRRALFVTSPNGLGHTLRDVAIARELRGLRPDVEVHWLAQDPVTRVIEARGERLHPGSRFLAPECAHVESEAGEHDLHVFQTIRTMDEILLANFMVLQDVLEAEPYALVVGDEAWEVASREAVLTADYNAEMLEQVARLPRIRDRALFVGNPEDVVEGTFGPGLPRIRDSTRQHFEFPGYILPFDPAEFADREGLRRRLGFHADEQVVFVAVGGTGVGHHLIRKVVAAFPEARRLVPELRMIVVAGPRIDPASVPQARGLEYRGFVPDLYAHLAACDLAVVQEGLSTCMELTATKRPFLYLPLRRHFEQQIHVAHRLDRYGAGTRMDYHRTEPEALAHAIAEGLKRPVMYRDVEADGARRAAALLTELI